MQVSVIVSMDGGPTASNVKRREEMENNEKCCHTISYFFLLFYSFQGHRRLVCKGSFTRNIAFAKAWSTHNVKENHFW